METKMENTNPNSISAPTTSEVKETTSDTVTESELKDSSEVTPNTMSNEKQDNGSTTVGPETRINTGTESKRDDGNATTESGTSTKLQTKQGDNEKNGNVESETTQPQTKQDNENEDTQAAVISKLKEALEKVRRNKDAWPFLDPVPDSVADYKTIVKQPMDISTIESKLNAQSYASAPLRLFFADMELIFDNCRLYNDKNTVFYKLANRVDAYVKRLRKKIEKELFQKQEEKEEEVEVEEEEELPRKEKIITETFLMEQDMEKIRKLREKTLIDKPVAIESDAVKEGVQELYSRPELNEVALFLWILTSHGLFKAPPFTLVALENGFALPTSSRVLDTIHTLLLLPIKEIKLLRKSDGEVCRPFGWWCDLLIQTLEEWNEQRNVLKAELAEVHKNGIENYEEEAVENVKLELDFYNGLLRPLFTGSTKRFHNVDRIIPFSSSNEYLKLSSTMRVKITRSLCTYRGYGYPDPSISEHIRTLENDSLRQLPLGSDSLGRRYFYFPQFFRDCRIYRESPREDGEEDSEIEDFTAEELILEEKELKEREEAAKIKAKREKLEQERKEKEERDMKKEPRIDTKTDEMETNVDSKKEPEIDMKPDEKETDVDTKKELEIGTKPDEMETDVDTTKNTDIRDADNSKQEDQTNSENIIRKEIKTEKMEIENENEKEQENTASEEKEPQKQGKAASGSRRGTRRSTRNGRSSTEGGVRRSARGANTTNDSKDDTPSEKEKETDWKWQQFHAGGRRSSRARKQVVRFQQEMSKLDAEKKRKLMQKQKAKEAKEAQVQKKKNGEEAKKKKEKKADSSAVKKSKKKTAKKPKKIYGPVPKPIKWELLCSDIEGLRDVIKDISKLPKRPNEDILFELKDTLQHMEDEEENIRKEKERVEKELKMALMPRKRSSRIRESKIQRIQREDEERNRREAIAEEEEQQRELRRAQAREKRAREREEKNRNDLEKKRQLEEKERIEREEAAERRREQRMRMKAERERQEMLDKLEDEEKERKRIEQKQERKRRWEEKEKQESEAKRPRLVTDGVAAADIMPGPGDNNGTCTSRHGQSGTMSTTTASAEGYANASITEPTSTIDENSRQHISHVVTETKKGTGNTGTEMMHVLAVTKPVGAVIENSQQSVSQSVSDTGGVTEDTGAATIPDPEAQPVVHVDVEQQLSSTGVLDISSSESLHPSKSTSEAENTSMAPGGNERAESAVIATAPPGSDSVV